MTMIPVVLELADIAADANHNFSLTTPGVAWSLGDGGRESLGFSHNARTLGEARSSYIKRIEVTDSVLAIQTGPGTTDPFTLTLFADVPPDTESVQGYCTLNDDARVRAYFGYEDHVEWRNGHISALTPDPRLTANFRRVLFTFRGIAPGQSIRISLATEAGHGTARWGFGPPLPTAAGFKVRSSSGEPLPIASLTMSAEYIELTIASSDSSTAADLMVEANLTLETPIDHIHLKVDCDSADTIFAQIGTQRPQYVTEMFSVFAI